ncbi:ferredoxin [Nocardioides sp.]|uniref:ferredoxin n=1 Tax=Nocardioides sp. TaxID=35761 RepID=UPI00261F0A10|nr:ferredoxin [Nocardioides sp.]
MTMRVVADLDICQGHQMCQAEAPTVFGFDEAADVVEVLEPHPDESLRPQVEAAVRYCPAFALTIVDPAPDPTPDPMSEEDR